MYNKYRISLYSYLHTYLVFMLVTISRVYTAEETETSFGNNTFVVFDPYVSILDVSNRHQYSIAEQIHFVAKVATKFNKVFIELTDYDLQENASTSRSESALAVAEYNKLSGTIRKLEVWLTYSERDRNLRKNLHFNNETQQHHFLQSLSLIAQRSNTIFNGSVTAIIFPNKLLDIQTIRILSNERSLQHRGFFLNGIKWGLLMEIREIKGLTHNPKADIIIFKLPTANVSSKLLDQVSFHLKQYQSYKEIMSVSVGVIGSAPDTDTNGIMNMTNLVSYWKALNKWSNKTGHTVVLSKAFDTPYEDALERKVCGWWRLLENPFYKSVRDYKFVEKETEAREYDERNGTTLNWLQKNMNFSKENVGIIFSLYSHNNSSSHEMYFNMEMHSLLQNIVANFKKVVLLLHNDSEEGTRFLLSELNCLKKIKKQVEISVVVLPNVNVDQMVKWRTSFLYRGNKTGQPVETWPFRTTNVVPVSKHMQKMNDMLYSLYDMGITSNKFGYSFNTSICNVLSKANIQERKAIGNLLKEARFGDRLADEIVFYFEESQDTVKLGADRMFSQRIVLLEECRRLFVEWDFDRKVKLSFMMLHYSVSSMFYERKWEMINFIRYWQKMSGWARDTGRNIILSNVVDSQRYFKQGNETRTEIGWWRRWVNENGRGIWIDKTEDVLKDVKFSKNETKVIIMSLPVEQASVTQPVLIGVFSLVLVAIVTVAAVYLRKNRYYQTSVLTKNEINEFFHGTDTSEPQRRLSVDIASRNPYRKTCYEVGMDSYTVEGDSSLGSGEFGKVCMGRISVQDGESIKVAVKMVNPRNLHKTALKGLLSEIKVLSHVGQHDHIIKLMGANTENLCAGKIFVFLELCELGSLESYLRQIKPVLEATKRNDSFLRQSSYQNRGENFEMSVLDSHLSQELLCWSRQICKGMAYLASKHVVHADLATRNVLLNGNKQAKICDFGLSRRMYNYTNYVKQQQEPLPWKWMAPESLKRSEFSEKSDVWAYGVTLWEIFSFGEVPYPGLSWDLKYADMLEGGFRLDKPKYDDFSMYEIMKECWHTIPANRPSFADLLMRFFSK